MLFRSLQHIKSVLPLFRPGALLRLVNECYAAQPNQRDPVAWASINVVLALASQQLPPAGGDSRSKPRAERTAEYVNNAQSVISTIMMGETGLLNIQALVGIVMVFMSAKDLTPSLILISAAMRLAHKMGLHDRAATAHLDTMESRQHANVFWLAYILDKDLSLRAQQPSVQLDDDIDLDLPFQLASDANGAPAGVASTSNGSATMNYLLARVQLAVIEGRIYD